MGIAKSGNKIIIAKNNIKTQGIAKAGNIIYSAGPPPPVSYIAEGTSAGVISIYNNNNGNKGTLVETIAKNNWTRLAYYAPDIEKCLNYVCYGWTGIGEPLNFAILKSTGTEFFNSCSDFNQPLSFPMLTTTASSFLRNCPALSNVKLLLENIVLNMAYGNNFIPLTSTTTNIITLELRAVQTLTSRPSNMLNYRPNNSAVISGVDLRINKDSVGVNVANKTWAGMTFRSITLIDEYGIAA